MISDSGFVLGTPEQIEAFRKLSRYHAFKLELLGMRRSGRSAHSIVKELHGFVGSRRSVFNQYQRYLEREGILREVSK